MCRRVHRRYPPVCPIAHLCDAVPYAISPALRTTGFLARTFQRLHAAPSAIRASDFSYPLGFRRPVAGRRPRASTNRRAMMGSDGRPGLAMGEAALASRVDDTRSDDPRDRGAARGDPRSCPTDRCSISDGRADATWPRPTSSFSGRTTFNASSTSTAFTTTPAGPIKASVSAVPIRSIAGSFAARRRAATGDVASHSGPPAP